MRSDAEANRERVLAAAVTTILREGRSVPMATIAAQAGVGVGTLYRRYPTRDALLSALAVRAFRLVLAAARESDDPAGPAIEAVGRFFDRTIAHRGDLVLPLHGAPTELDAEARAVQAEVRAALTAIVERGHRDGSIRPDATAGDLVIAGAILANPLAVADWDRTAHRHKRFVLDGLRPICSTGFTCTG